MGDDNLSLANYDRISKFSPRISRLNALVHGIAQNNFWDLTEVLCNTGMDLELEQESRPRVGAHIYEHAYFYTNPANRGKLLLLISRSSPVELYQLGEINAGEPEEFLDLVHSALLARFVMCVAVTTRSAYERTADSM